MLASLCRFRGGALSRAFSDAKLAATVNITELFVSDDPETRKQGHKLMVAAARRGDAKAQFALGMAHRSGLHEIEKNMETSINYLKQAADQGHPQAQYYYATSMQNVSRDEYLKYLKMSADSRCIDAIRDYAVHLFGAKELTKALEYLKIGVEMSDPFCEFALAGAMLQGKPTPEEADTALALLQRSADGGYEPAKETLKMMKDEGLIK